MSSTYETLLYEPEGHVLVITLNRPEKLNAWNGRMETEFLDTLDAASADGAIRAIVVTGAGRAFCAGGDIGAWSQDLSSNSRRQASPLLARDGSPDVPIALGSTRYLPLVAGMGNALFMALTGRIIDAREAKERGIVDRVVPHDSLLPEAMALADEIAANPPAAVWLAKRLIHENANESDLRRVVTGEGFAIREARRQPDHAEAVQAFVEKRSPKFGG